MRWKAARERNNELVKDPTRWTQYAVMKEAGRQWGFTWEQNRKCASKLLRGKVRKKITSLKKSKEITAHTNRMDFFSHQFPGIGYASLNNVSFIKTAVSFLLPVPRVCQRWWRKHSRWARCCRWVWGRWWGSLPPALDLELYWSPCGSEVQR